MYSKILSCACLIAVGPLMAGRGLLAQSGEAPIPSPSSVRFAVGGGFVEAAPFGGQGIGDIGYNFLGALERRTPVPGLHLRTDASFASWGSGQQLAAISGGIALRAPDRWRAAPAFIATGGGYRSSRSSAIRPGWSLGAGLRVPVGGQALLIESRIHAFHVGARDLATAGVSPLALEFNRWQHTYAPLTFSIQF